MAGFPLETQQHFKHDWLHRKKQQVSSFVAAVTQKTLCCDQHTGIDHSLVAEVTYSAPCGDQCSGIDHSPVAEVKQSAPSGDQLEA